MTNFDRVKGYYRVFDEKNRLVNSGSGKLEYMMSMDLVKHWLPENGKSLDLGGGAGAYSFPLAAEGYKVTLADLSEELIRQAEEQNEQTDYPVTCNVVNAVDLSQYHDREFDAVLLMGPLYHLLEKSERDQGVKTRRNCICDIPALSDRKHRHRGSVLRSSGTGERRNHQGGIPVRTVQ